MHDSVLAVLVEIAASLERIADALEDMNDDL